MIELNATAAEVARAVDKLTRAGVPIGNQSVLLRGINDCPTIMKKLVHELVKIRCRPYYFYQCDLSRGLEHFRTSVEKGLEIAEALNLKRPGSVYARSLFLALAWGPVIGGVGTYLGGARAVLAVEILRKFQPNAVTRAEASTR